MDWRFFCGQAADDFLPRKEASGSSLLRSSPLAARTLIVCVMLWPTAALAQSGQSDQVAPDIMVRSTLPDAKALPAPGPDTPVPSWAQKSYKIYLQMKAKAHGGTDYSRGTSPKCQIGLVFGPIMVALSGIPNHLRPMPWASA